MNNTEQSPQMAQYDQLKEEYPNSLLLFGYADDYTLYKKDAIEASKLLRTIMTRRCGTTYEETGTTSFPRRALDVYLPKLVRAGHSVAIFDPGIVEMITPSKYCVK